MGLKKVVQNWLGIKANPIASKLVGTGYDGKGQPPDQDIGAHLDIMKIEAWAYVSLNVIGKNLSSAPLIIKRKEIDDNGDLVWMKTEDAEIEAILENPNDDEPFDQLLWKKSLSLLGAGNGYWSTTDNEFHYIKPDWVEVVLDTEGIKGYIVDNKTDGKPIPFERDEMIHFKLPSPYGTAYGYSPMDTIQETLLSNLYNRKYIKNFFKNSAMPSGTLSTEQNLGGETEATRVAWEKIYKGADNAQRIAILDKGTKYASITSPLKDLVVDTLAKMNREEIIAVFGLPPVMAGIYEYANYANSEAQIKIFWQTTILPLLRLISGTMNVQWKLLKDKGLRVEFDLSKIEALQEDEEKKATRLVKLVGGGIFTANEARAEYNKEPLEEGEELRVRQNVGVGVAVDDDDDDGEKKSLMPSRGSSPTDEKTDRRQLIWSEHERKLARYEAKLEKIVKRFWNDQLRRIIKQQNDTTGNGKFMSRVGLCFKIGDDITADNVDAFFDLEFENKELEKLVKPFFLATMAAEGQEEIEKLIIDMTFNYKDPNVSVAVQNSLNRSTRINNKTYNDYKILLEQGYKEGIGIDALERRTRELFRSYYKAKPGDSSLITRGRRFARTEVNGIVNGAKMISGIQGGATHKEWISTQDPNTRDTHGVNGADGEVVKIGEPFINSGEPLNHPGDPSGSAGNVINCRCSFVNIVKGEDEDA